MRVTDVSNNSQASLMAQQAVSAAQQQPALNASMQHLLEAQRLAEQQESQVNARDELDEDNAVHEDNERQQGRQGRRRRRQDSEDDHEQDARPRASDDNKGKLIDLDA